MKKIYTIVVALFLSAIVFAQALQKMSYQAVIRDASNNLVTSHSVGMKISILQGSATGTVVYTETQTPTTNANGLISIEFGGGTGFSSIDWSTGSYFIQTETDPTGGTNYTINGTSQLLSVPYAMYAGSAGTTTSGHYIGELFGGGIIFWLSPDNKHGLVMSLKNVSNSAIWTNSKTTIGADDMYDGLSNTKKIIAVTGTEDNAALKCKNYNAGGFSDWFLPSVWQLSIIFKNVYTLNYVLLNDNDTSTEPIISSGYFNNSFYWSSTECTDTYSSDAPTAFENSYPSSSYMKSANSAVRAIRAF